MSQTEQKIEKRDYLLKRVGKEEFTKIDPEVFYDPIILKRKLQKGSGYGDYARLCDNGKMIMFHRYILKPEADLVCDHINGDKLDNRRKNLRNVTRRQNMLNRKLKNTTGYISVTSDSSGKCCVRYRKKDRKRWGKYAKNTPKNLMLLALLRDKWILMENEEDYAPMNFPLFKNEPYRSILLAMEIEPLVRAQKK